MYLSLKITKYSEYTVSYSKSRTVCKLSAGRAAKLYPSLGAGCSWEFAYFLGIWKLVLGLRTFVLHRLFSSFKRDWKKADHVDFSRENLPRSWGSPGLESADACV